MKTLHGLQRVKNEYAIYLRSASYAWRVAMGRSIARDNRHVSNEYAGLHNDADTLDDECIVRTREGLALVSQRQLRQESIDLVSKVAQKIKAKRLIEFGCGDGLNIGLSTLNAEFHGFDLVPERVERAKRNAPRATLWAGDATENQVNADSFDLAYSIHAIEQIRNGWDRAIANMRLAAKHVLLIEPFYERKGLHGKLHTLANGYFQGRIADVLNLGLEIEDQYSFNFWDPWNKSTALLLRRI